MKNLLGLNFTAVGLAITVCLSLPLNRSARAQDESGAPKAPSVSTADTLSRDPGNPVPSNNPHRKRPKRRPAAPAAGQRKIVVREGGADEPATQIVPGSDPAEAARQRSDAARWLIDSDIRLKQLAVRSLTPPQQDAIGQIRKYMDGARLALKEGDLRRASTLAEKANLLSDDLIKHP